MSFRLAHVVVLASLVVTARVRADDAARAADQEPPPLLERVAHRYAENDGVRIHYVEIGKGPLVVLLHGFPDWWYTWREQMDALAREHRVVAVDLRGYNRSDQPKGVDAYRMERLIGDVAAVIRHAGAERATIVGHDWGGAIAWSVAMYRPELCERLIVLNLPHPRGIRRELATNPRQRENSAYARRFQEEGAHESLTPVFLAAWVEDPRARELYIEAFGRSSIEGMLAFYKANYPKEPYEEDDGPVVKVKVPVLLIHGLEDQALLPGALSGTWDWVEDELTLLTIPGAGHFVQQDAAERVTRALVSWLRESRAGE